MRLGRFAENLWALVKELGCLWLCLVAFILVSTLVLWLVERKWAPKEEPNRIGSVSIALYVTLITFLTIGYGDFVPKTLVGRSLAVVNACVGVTVLGLWIGVVVYAMQGTG